MRLVQYSRPGGARCRRRGTAQAIKVVLVTIIRRTMIMAMMAVTIEQGTGKKRNKNSRGWHS
jgi:hypothetical protein